MANIIASGKTLLASTEFTLLAGVSTNVFITSAISDDATPSALAKVQMKSGSTWMTVGVLKYGELAKTIYGPGTFRVVRPLTTGDAIAVDRE